MKIILFLCLFVSQTSAWFFDDFRGAISSVENSVGKLLTDVVEDVEESVGCTIFAVKKVLALDGNEPSDYDVRCRGQSNSGTASVQETLENYSPTPTVMTSSLSNHDHKGKSLSERVSEEISDSVENVKDKMMDIIGSHDTHNKIVEVKNKLKNETDRLSEVGGILHGEFNNLTEDVKRVLSKVQTDYIHPSFDNIWQSIKTLHDIELNHPNAHDASEIRHILNEILTVLSSDDERNRIHNIDQKDCDSNKIFTLLKNQFDKMKENEGSSALVTTGSISVGDIINTQNVNDIVKSGKDGGVINEIPVMFKDETKKIVKEDSHVDLPRTVIDIAKNVVSKAKEDLSVDFPITFKDVAKNIVKKGKEDSHVNVPATVKDIVRKIVKETKKDLPVVNDNASSQKNKQKPKFNKVIVSLNEKPTDADADILDYYSMLGIPQDSHSSQDAALEVKQLIEKSKETDKIMSSFFENSDDIGTNVFDSPDFLNF